MIRLKTTSFRVSLTPTYVATPFTPHIGQFLNISLRSHKQLIARRPLSECQQEIVWKCIEWWYCCQRAHVHLWLAIFKLARVIFSGEPTVIPSPVWRLCTLRHVLQPPCSTLDAPDMCSTLSLCRTKFFPQFEEVVVDGWPYIFLVAAEQIEKNDEIVVDYGPGYPSS